MSSIHLGPWSPSSCIGLRFGASYQYLLDSVNGLDAPGHIASAPVKAITVNEEKISDYAQFAEQLLKTSSGRFTVRGENGSGKSTLLLFLKKHLAENSFYLPTSLNELAWNFESRPLSTGQMQPQAYCLPPQFTPVFFPGNPAPGHFAGG